MDEVGEYCHYPGLPAPVNVPLETPPPHPCPYLPGREATLRGFYASRMGAEVYHRFLDAGFRRAGRVIYQPICRGCRACMPIRVAVAEFRPGKSLRRCWRRNADLNVSVDEPVLTEEKCALYQRYLAARHDKQMDDDAGSLEDFLYQSPVRTVEFTYRFGKRGSLAAVGICDVSAGSVSSVYFFFEPRESRRGLGNFGAMVEIEYARRLKIPHWYLGYWVKGCRAMEYKANFRPHELLWPDGGWRRSEETGQKKEETERRRDEETE
jgi:leucyl-tRNA---protein transferase